LDEARKRAEAQETSNSKKICEETHAGVEQKADAKPEIAADEAMKLANQLRGLGYGDEAIAAMKPKEAHNIVVARRQARPGVRDWDEIEVPPGANALERLTYVPGAVGDIAGFVVGAAIRPNRMMALAVGLGVVGTLIGRKIVGPKNNATHLYIVMLAPTGYGKDDPMTLGTAVMEAVDARHLLGPQEYASVPGLPEIADGATATIVFRGRAGG
jgi:hypothetical protein